MSGPVMASLLFLTALAAVLIYLRDPLRAWRRYRGERLVICPETAAAAAVMIDTGHAALTALVEGQPDLRLACCSRWAERGRCDEPCVHDVEAAGDAARVGEIVRRWYETRTCGYCGRKIAAAGPGTHAPALIGVDGITVAWCDVPAERLPELFQSARAVCPNCHLAETFRRTHADIVFERR
jgi:hypothetical protein